jgi:hypothetical protein
VVLPDGRVVKCDGQRHEDLFWALRGAGSRGLGVVTSLTLRTLPEPAATAFHLEWPFERASALIAAWQQWSPSGPDELAASVLVTVGGGTDAEPVVHLFGSMIAGESDTAVLLDEFVSRAGTEPASSERAHMRYGSLKAYLAQRGPGDQEDQHGHPYMRSEFFRAPLPAGAIDALAERFVRGRRPGEARKLDFMPWGGAYNRVPADATAFPHREELFLLEHSVVVPAPSDAATTEAARLPRRRRRHPADARPRRRLRRDRGRPSRAERTRRARSVAGRCASLVACQEETLEPLGEPRRRCDEMPCAGCNQALRVERDGQGIADAFDPGRVIA